MNAAKKSQIEVTSDMEPEVMEENMDENMEVSLCKRTLTNTLGEC